VRAVFQLSFGCFGQSAQSYANLQGWSIQPGTKMEIRNARISLRNHPSFQTSVACAVFFFLFFGSLSIRMINGDKGQVGKKNYLIHILSRINKLSVTNFK
jgi:hypothetical protein